MPRHNSIWQSYRTGDMWRVHTVFAAEDRVHLVLWYDGHDRGGRCNVRLSGFYSLFHEVDRAKVRRSALLQ